MVGNGSGFLSRIQAFVKDSWICEDFEGDS